MKKILILNLLALIGCSSAEELKHSFNQVSGQSISIIRSHPVRQMTAINGNTVYVYSPHSTESNNLSIQVNNNKRFPCEIFIEVNSDNMIIGTSYKGNACNSFYERTMNPYSND